MRLHGFITQNFGISMPLEKIKLQAAKIILVHPKYEIILQGAIEKGIQ